MQGQVDVVNVRPFAGCRAVPFGKIFFVLGMALAPALKDTIYESTTDPILGCHNATITNQNQAICTSLEVMSPFFIGLIFGLSGAAYAMVISVLVEIPVVIFLFSKVYRSRK